VSSGEIEQLGYCSWFAKVPSMYFLWVMEANEAQLSLNRAIRTYSIYSGGVRYDSCKTSDKV